MSTLKITHKRVTARTEHAVILIRGDNGRIIGKVYVSAEPNNKAYVRVWRPLGDPEKIEHDYETYI